MVQQVGRYEIRSLIGRGGMASVFLAEDPLFRRQVAVKLLPPTYLENPVLRARFEREARLIATIEHPAIVPVYDFGEQSGQLYLVMRYMAGGSLAERLRRTRLSLAEAIQMITALAPALDAVHSRNVVHRDLKPANILFDRFGNPAISDFGIAHLSEATVELTGEALVGTPAYMSPEQVQGAADIDGRSDLYALGVILYEMLSGKPPYQAPTPMSVAIKHITEAPPKILSVRPDLPPEIGLVIEKALHKDRKLRYARAADLVFDLQALPTLVSPVQPPAPNPLSPTIQEPAAAEAALVVTELEPPLESPPASAQPEELRPPEEPVKPGVQKPVVAEKTSASAEAEKPGARADLISPAAGAASPTKRPPTAPTYIPAPPAPEEWQPLEEAASRQAPVTASPTPTPPDVVRAPAATPAPGRSSAPGRGVTRAGKTYGLWLSLGGVLIIGFGLLVCLPLSVFALRSFNPTLFASILPGNRATPTSPPAPTELDVAAPTLAPDENTRQAPTDAPTSTPRPRTPVLTFTPITKILFADDFSTKANAWPESSAADVSYRYENGRYIIDANEFDSIFWVTADPTFTDTSTQVEATLLAGTPEDYFGLVCREQADKNFYYFIIRTDGTYVFGRHDQEGFHALTPGGWTYNAAIKQGNAVNLLRLDCVGNTMRLFANQTLLEEYTDDTLQEGKIGMTAAVLNQDGVQVAFDDLVVSEPAP